MSVAASTWAWGLPVTPTQKLVLLVLADYAGMDDSVAYPSHSKITDKTGLSNSAVRRALVDLEQRGFIERVDRYRENGSQTSNIYTLVMVNPPVTVNTPLFTVNTPPGHSEHPRTGRRTSR